MRILALKDSPSGKVNCRAVLPVPSWLPLWAFKGSQDVNLNFET